METPVLEIKALSKSYGRLKALDDFSLIVNKGEICGMLGPNGSGKTTTLGILLDILIADEGTYCWFGQAPTSNLRKRVGALLEQPLFYPYLSAVRNLQIIADIKKTSYNQIDEIIQTVGLSARKDSKYSTFSLGMKQRLAIAAALIGNPDVLILDEPTNGLDPQGIAEIRELILNISRKGMTIILASHLLDEVQKICTHVVILEKGKKRHAGRVDEVLNNSAKLELAAPDLQALRDALQRAPFILNLKEEGEILLATIDQATNPAEISKYLADQQLYLTHLYYRKQSLEKYFLELLKENNA